MLSSSVVCLSFTAELNTFEKESTFKILVYNSVIDINQIDVTFCSLTSG